MTSSAVFLALISITYVAVGYFLLAAVDWAYLALRGIGNGAQVRVTDDEAYSIADEHLPTYSILIPIFGRPDIADHLLESLARIDYPTAKLTVYIVVAADDTATRAAFNITLPQHVRLALTPPGAPRTKAYACNYALSLPDEQSDYVTVFGADDVPDPLQLRRAAYAFANASQNVAVFQCKLGFYNENQSLLTQWGAIERIRWFSLILPALSRISGIVPLGGSSSHIRKSLVSEVGGWHSTTAIEEAEMTIRFSRYGYRTLVLDSFTKGKAASTLRSWLLHRSQWYVANLQTLFAHGRNPVQFYRNLGLTPLLRFVNHAGGRQIWCLLNVALCAAFIGAHFTDDSVRASLHWPWMLYLAGNAIALCTNILTVIAGGKPRLIWAALLVPVCWILQAFEVVVTALTFARIWWASARR